MTWSEIPLDVFEVLAPNLARSHLKSLHLVNRRFNALVKRYVRRLQPKSLNLSKSLSFPNVTSLDLSRCWDRVADQSIVALARIWGRTKATQLRHLSLAKCHGVTNKGVAAISRHLPYLEELNLGGCRSSVPASYIGYTGVDGETLEGLQRLKRLHLRWNAVTDSSFQSVTRLQNLTHLDLGECHRMSEGGLALLGCFVKMEALNLERTKMNRRCIRTLAELKFLKSLSLRQCSEIDDLCVVDLTQLLQLTNLDLGKLNGITDDGVCHLIKLPDLRALDLAYATRLNGAWVEGNWPNNSQWVLRELRLEDCCNWATDRVLGRIAFKMPDLQELVLQNCTQVGRIGLRHLHALDLTTFDLSRCPNWGIEILTSMKRLVHLNLEFCTRITDRGLQELQSLPCLQSLVLNCCRSVTSAGIRALHPLKSKLHRLEIAACHGVHTDVLFYLSNWFNLLEVLNVSWLPISDTQFRSLKNLKRLSRVDIRGCHELSQEVLKEYWYLDVRTDTQNLEVDPPYSLS